MSRYDSSYGRDRGRDSDRDSYGGGGRRDGASDCKLYVGDLPRDASEKDLERAFSHYGPLRSVWVARNPPGFAFVEFEDSRDADDAVRALDGSNICGVRARVELSSGRSRPKMGMRRGGARGGGGGRKGFDPDDKCYECGERGHYAYDCRNKSGGGRSKSRRSRSRSYDRSTSKRSRSYDRNRSYSRSRSRSRGRDRSRSRSP